MPGFLIRSDLAMGSVFLCGIVGTVPEENMKRLFFGKAAFF